MMVNDHNHEMSTPSYFDFSNYAMNSVYDIRALIEAARCRLDAYEHANKANELVDLDRVLHIAVCQLTALVERIDEKTYAYTLKSPLPKAAHAG